jgi:hypothetical protein
VAVKIRYCRFKSAYIQFELLNTEIRYSWAVTSISSAIFMRPLFQLFDVNEARLPVFI